MDPVTVYLIDWAKHFFKHKDVLTKTIEDIKETDSGLHISKKDMDMEVIVKPVVEDVEKLSIDKDKKYSLIFLNNKENFEKIVSEWNTLKMFPLLTIYFINPFSPEQKWVIQPHVHDRISDRESFKSGIKSLFETVEEITVSELQRKIS
tara:strand:- start:1009 stop:1455 length:447 start_codon:yes stop_codon:yes gene_type:complete